MDVSPITSEELGYLSGLTGNVQEQLANINDYIYLDAADITLTDTEAENKEVLVQKAKVALEAKYPSAAAKSAAVVNATFTPSDRVEAHMFKYTGTEWVYQFQLTTGIKPADHDVAGTVESSEDITFVSGKGTVVQAGKVKRRLRIKNGATSKYFDGSEDVEFTYSDIGAASAAQGALADTAIQTATVIHTETLPSGSAATAEIVKTGTEIGFNFGIPRGAAGAKLFPVGAWTANTDYVCNDTKIDIVNYDGNGYACNQSHTSSNTFDPTKWTILVHQGEPGPKGDPGSKGDPGDIGTAAGFATPYIPKGYSAELLECQRYFQWHSKGFHFYLPYVGGNQWYANLPYPTEMRIIPTLSCTAVSGTFVAAASQASRFGAKLYGGSTTASYQCIIQDIILNAEL